MDVYDLAEAAERSGVSADELARLVELGIVAPDHEGRFTAGHLRRASLVHGLAESGIPLEGLGSAIRSGAVSLDFIDAPAYRAVLRASAARPSPRWPSGPGCPSRCSCSSAKRPARSLRSPTDRIRDEELPYVDLLEGAAAAGIPTAGLQQMGRTQGDSMRRIAETESAMWQAEVIEPAHAARHAARRDRSAASFGDRMSALTERAVIAMYHLQQARAWTAEHPRGDRDAAGRRRACTAASSIRRRCASSTSPATRA